jgi:hypothetical protein
MDFKSSHMPQRRCSRRCAVLQKGTQHWVLMALISSHYSKGRKGAASLDRMLESGGERG